MNISDRVFGSDFDPLVKNKLKARQLLSAGIQPNDPITTSNEFEESNPLESHLYKKHNFKGEYDLGSRLPWARMWAVISLYTVNNSDIENPIKEASFDQKIYTVGNNVLFFRLNDLLLRSCITLKVYQILHRTSLVYHYSKIMLPCVKVHLYFPLLYYNKFGKESQEINLGEVNFI